MPSLFSEWEAPKPVYGTLMEEILKARLEEEEPPDLWTPPSDSELWFPSIDTGPAMNSSAQNTSGYLQVFLEGGLNQQRIAICDAVAVAKLLGVTLILPEFDVNPFWQDSSSFADIFDVDHFLQALTHDVSIVRDLPREFFWSSREYYATGIRATRVKNTPARSPPSWFFENVLPVIKMYGIAAVVPFSHRLAYDDIPLHIQRLRCKVNFQALRFVPAIIRVGDAIIERLQFMETERFIQRDTDYLESIKAGDLDLKMGRNRRKFLALHLRFDRDMAAHSSCEFGGGKIERLALAKYRRDLWNGRVSNSHHSDLELRQLGKCPLTPEETGLLLGGLGFNHSTRLYVASYKVYGGTPRMAPLQKLFPLMQSKFSLTSEQEITPFRNKASQLAALDYYVSLQSDVFISASPGNMHNALVGHRTYAGVKKTIRPDLSLLSRLFMNATIKWTDFQEEVRHGHRNRIGNVKPRQHKQSLYTYPAPDCVCKRE
ncbi:hypothetical protein KP509_03G031700 [Ceratopteris richardii]|nr:hypothetical protein KP509_03G031700 [Ceratopteris richardii]